MNPRYLAYCRAHNKAPADMIAADSARYPGGCMAGYICWSNERLNEFARLSGTTAQWIDLAEYDKWLQKETANK